MTKPAESEGPDAYEVAIHEAGHAVMAFEAEFEGAQTPVGGVSIIPDERSLGRLIHETLREGVRNEQDSSAIVDLDRQMLIMVCLAGAVANAVAEQRSSSHDNLYERVPVNPDFTGGCAQDWQIAEWYARQLSGGDPEEAQALLHWLTEKTSRFLQFPPTWHAVTTLADRLLEARYVSGEDAQAIWREARSAFRMAPPKAGVGDREDTAS